MKARTLLSLALLAASPGSAAQAQASRELPVDQVKQILAQTLESWLAFRVYDGRNLIYFTHLATYHCALLEIRYSFNGTALDRRFPVPKCNPLLPFNVGADDTVYLEAREEDAKTVAVQLVYDDNSVSDVHVFQPCPGAGDATCAIVAETRPAESTESGKIELKVEPSQRSAPSSAPAPAPAQ
jgi:hypothetical protein